MPHAERAPRTADPASDGLHTAIRGMMLLASGLCAALALVANQVSLADASQYPRVLCISWALGLIGFGFGACWASLAPAPRRWRWLWMLATLGVFLHCLVDSQTRAMAA